MAFLSPELSSEQIREEARSHLSRTPAGPDFVQPTIDYCDTGMHLALSMIHEGLSRKFQGTSEQNQKALESALDTQGKVEGALAKSQARGTMYIKDGRQSKVAESSITTLLTQVAPELGNPEYINLFGRNAEYFLYSVRFNQLQELLGADSPLLSIIAVTYATQVAKDSGVKKVHALLARALDLENQESPNLDGYINVTQRQVGGVNTDEAYMQEGKRHIEQLAREQGLDRDNLQLLFDLAFMKESMLGTDISGRFHKLFDPIARQALEGNWDMAFAHRDFLLRYLGDMFPDWRRKEFQKTATGTVYNNLQEIIEAVKSEKLDLEGIDIPEAYKDIVPNMVGRDMIKMIRARNYQILYATVNISAAILNGQLPGSVSWDPSEGLVYKFIGNDRIEHTMSFPKFLRHEIIMQDGPGLIFFARHIGRVFQDTPRQNNFSLNFYLSALLYPMDSEKVQNFIHLAEKALEELQQKS